MAAATVRTSVDETPEFTEKSPMIEALRAEKQQHLRTLVENLLTTEHLRRWCTDAQIVRFLKATNWDLNKSTQRLRTTLEWRAKHVPEPKPCSHCAKDAHAHHMFECGFDKEGRPVIYSCFELAHQRRDGDSNTEHLVAVLDRVMELMPPGVTQYLWVCDFHGFGLWDCNVAMAINSIQVFANHYPETLAGIYMVGAPKIFDMFWSSLTAVIRHSNVTLAKIHFIQGPEGNGAGEALRPLLERMFDEELVLWITEEMTENRDAECVSHKLGHREAVDLGDGRTRHGGGGTHDLRGTATFRKRLAQAAASESVYAPQWRSLQPEKPGKKK